MTITGKSLCFHTAYIDLPQICFWGGASLESFRILVSQLGIKPAVETRSLNHWTIREVPCLKLLMHLSPTLLSLWLSPTQNGNFGKFFFNLFNSRLITLQYCSGFCHTLTWIRHGCTCVPYPEPCTHLPPHLIPQGYPSAPALSTLSQMQKFLTKY